MTTSIFPPETLELVFAHLSRVDLARLLTASALFHNVAARVLYRALVDIRLSPALHLLKTLVRNSFYPLLVRRFDLEWTDGLLTANFLRLLQRVLQRLRHLVHLGLEFASTDNLADLAWILHDAPFSLRVFTTTMRCDPALARFLATQPDLVELCLRGFHPPPPGTPTPTITAAPAPAAASAAAFALPPTALPRLRHFRTVLASPAVTATFLANRPLESVALSLYYPCDTPAALDALQRAAPRPGLRRLTVMAFGGDTPAQLVAQIARRVPAIEALHAVVLLKLATTHDLLDAARALTQFTALRYLTFVAPGTLSSEDESEIATAWGRACPTLRTIILPQGIVWSYVDGEWVSMQDL